MKVRILVLLAAMFAVMAIGAACGGDDKLSNEDYYKKLETLSQDTDKKIEELNAKTPESEEGDALKGFIVNLFEENLGIVEGATKKLEELKPSDEVKPKHDAFVTAIKTQTEALKKVLETLKDAGGDQYPAILTTINLDATDAARTAACTALQDDAKSKSITIDLKCVD